MFGLFSEDDCFVEVFISLDRFEECESEVLKLRNEEDVV